MWRASRKNICRGKIAAISLAAIWLCTVAANAQWYARFGGTMGAAATGQFTTSLTTHTTGSNGELPPHEATTNSPGMLLSFRAYPVVRSGIELNYHDTKFQQLFSSGAAMTLLPTNAHEATAAYLFRLHLDRLHLRRFVPYVGVGGGYTAFTLTTASHNPSSQWRETGLVEVSWDKRLSSKLGLRLGTRDVIYRAPNFNVGTLPSSRWVSTLEPFGGVYIRLKGE